MTAACDASFINQLTIISSPASVVPITTMKTIIFSNLQEHHDKLCSPPPPGYPPPVTLPPALLLGKLRRQACGSILLLYCTNQNTISLTTANIINYKISNPAPPIFAKTFSFFPSLALSISVFFSLSLSISLSIFLSLSML